MRLNLSIYLLASGDIVASYQRYRDLTFFRLRRLPRFYGANP